MNKILVSTETGKPVKYGEVITSDIMYGYGIVMTVSAEVNACNIPFLIENGILKEEDSVNKDISYYEKKVFEKLYDWNGNYFNCLKEKFPSIALNLVLKEIAIEFDKQYEGHIEDSPEIYSISNLNGRICEANKNHIKNYRNFAAFRNKKDAETALSITKDYIKRMFEYQHKKDV